MAEGGVDLENDSLERVVTCQICFHFMEDARILLPCTHSFCTDCVMKLNRKRHRNKTTLSCPMCREDILEENIHKNRTMAELIDIVKAKKQNNTSLETGMICAQCDSSNATFKCTNCDGILCEKCEQHHSRLPKCKNKTLPIEEVEKIGKKNPTIYCIRHTNEPIKMNCHSCDIAICSECKFTTHDNHTSESLESAVERYRNTVTKALVGVKKKTKFTTIQIAQVKRKIEKVKENQTKVQADIDETCEKLISLINTERQTLSSELQLQCGAQLKELQLELESLENSLSCDNSIQTWTEAIMTNTDGGVLLTELQSGLFNKIQQLEQQIEPAKKQSSGSCTMYDLKVSNQILSPSLGELVTSAIETDKLASEIELLGVTNTGITSYRHVNFDLNTLVQRQLSSQHDIKIYDIALRMCLHKNKLYLPCYKKNTIKVLTLTGEIIQTTKLQGIDTPRSLHPLDGDQLILASYTGVHILDSNTLTITSQLASGDFDDVYVDGDTIVALTFDKMTLLNAKQMSQPKHICFSVDYELDGYDTLCVHDNHIYVCTCDAPIILQYNMQGDLIQMYEGIGYGDEDTRPRKAEELDEPYVCLTDNQGNLLVASCGNDRLQVLSATGQWSVLPIEVYRPYDVVVVDNMLYVLHSDFEHSRFSACQPVNFKITIYKL